jgi:alpha-L-fucosidase
MSGPDGSVLPPDPAADGTTERARLAALETFTQNRFGLFVHWGLYSLAARHEWVRQREHLPRDEYRRYLDYFDPDLYDPQTWAQAAAGAGIRYAVLTTKHHDGFCLWETEHTDFSVRATPHRRDLVGPFVEAFRARGLGVGFYHSLLDWDHPQFPIDGLHPEARAVSVEDEGARAENAGRDVARYRAYLHAQVAELLTRYGPDLLWFDFSYAQHVHLGEPVWAGKGAPEWGSEELLALVRRLRPGCLVNDRLGIPGDFRTAEQYQPAQAITQDGRPVPWEACQTLNGSWGYDRDNTDVKSPDLLVRMLIDTVAKGGNLLLNVGPDGRGRFDPAALDTLAAIGRWMSLHARAIHGAGPSDLRPPTDCRYTRRGNRLYLHLFAWPYEAVHLPGLAGRVRYAQFLHDASQLRTEVLPPGHESALADATGGDPLTLWLPVRRPDVAVPVVELFLTED